MAREDKPLPERRRLLHSFRNIIKHMTLSRCFISQVKQVLDEIIEKLPEEFNMTEIMGKVEERTPYVIVAFQECERMNFLTTEIKRSLRELDLGLKGELTITSDMENLENALFLDQVPPVWANRAYPSLLGLTAWFVDLLLRIRELETWSTDFVVCI